jgi:predicted phosphodiesterase
VSKILVISDNHGVDSIMSEIIAKERPDLAVHAGDFGISLANMQKLFNYFVNGNNDHN